MTEAIGVQASCETCDDTVNIIGDGSSIRDRDRDGNAVYFCSRPCHYEWKHPVIELQGQLVGGAVDPIEFRSTAELRRYMPTGI